MCVELVWIDGDFYFVWWCVGDVDLGYIWDVFDVLFEFMVEYVIGSS